MKNSFDYWSSHPVFNTRYGLLYALSKKYIIMEISIQSLHFRWMEIVVYRSKNTSQTPKLYTDNCFLMISIAICLQTVIFQSRIRILTFFLKGGKKYGLFHIFGTGSLAVPSESQNCLIVWTDGLWNSCLSEAYKVHDNIIMRSCIKHSKWMRLHLSNFVSLIMRYEHLSS